MLERWGRLYRSVRPLSASQWAARARWVLYRRLYRAAGGTLAHAELARARKIAATASGRTLLSPGWPEALCGWPGLEETLAHADKARAGCFTFLNEMHPFRPGVSWSDPELSQLWRYHLHYFGCALALGAAFRVRGDVGYYAAFRDLAADWIETNPLGRGDGWHPYTVSLRAVHWIVAAEMFAEPLRADPAFSTPLMESLALQCRYLRRHLEFDVGGNHLIENLRALLWAGAFFDAPEARAWGQTARSRISRQVAIQVLPDGGHFERTPMYHGIVLEDFLEVLALCRNAGQEAPEGLAEAINRMLRWLSAMLHPDGGIPLFNDAVFGEGPSPGALGAFAEALLGDAGGLPAGEPDLRHILLAGSRPPARAADLPESVDLPASGYYTFGHRQGSSGWAVIDAGEPCPKNLPAHAHCDLLSFELSLGPRRFLTDSGVFEYARGAMRAYVRSTRAHNTVVVDGAEQSEVWDSFRVGRRARPLDVRFVRTPELELLRASHDGFSARWPGLRHTRLFALLEGRVWVIVDALHGAASRPEHAIESFLHWHPDVALVREKTTWRAHRDGIGMLFAPVGWQSERIARGEDDPPQGWYCPAFGVRQERDVLCLSARRSVPFIGAYVLAPHAGSLQIEAPAGAPWRISVDTAVMVFDPHPFLGEGDFTVRSAKS